MNRFLLPDHSEDESCSSTDSVLEKLVLKSNQSAMLNLEQNKPNHVLFYLNQSLLSCKQMQNSDIQNRLMALTYNNLACYFQSIKNSVKALEFLFKAISLLSATKDVVNLSASHLNICSILSSLGEHERALRHALKCMYMLRTREKFSVTLAKAYLAAGNQYKILKQGKDALECYEKGLSLCKLHLGSGHSLTLLLQNALNSFKSATVAKQKTSGTIRKYTPVLHSRTKSSFEEKLIKRIQLGKSLSKSIERQKETQTRLANSAKVSNDQKRSSKKFDILQQRMQEKNAAVLIQSWWRGVSARKGLEICRLEKEIKEAEDKARRAAEYAENLKAKAALRSSPKKPSKPADKTKAAIKIQKAIRSFLAKKKKQRLAGAVRLIKKFIVLKHRSTIFATKNNNTP